jgi:hypothetical protein
MTLRWPWDAALREAMACRDEARAAAAEALSHADEARSAHAKALQCALAAGEAAMVAGRGGAGDGTGWGMDPDLDTLDTHRTS